jgi:hypothetical protein
MSEWLDIMLEEIARKRREAEAATEERSLREQTDADAAEADAPPPKPS